MGADGTAEGQVDAASASPGFRVRFRGYDRYQVDIYLKIAALGDAGPPAPFDVVLRGYDRAEVDEYVRRMRSRARPDAAAEQEPPGSPEGGDAQDGQGRRDAPR